MKSMTVKEIAAACGGEFFGVETLLTAPVDAIDTDTRRMKPGSLFIPIKGENFDGHDFIEKAFENGASLTLSEKDVEGRPYIKVESTFQALKDIAEYYRSLFDIKVIAITGSVGKTTTKEMIYSVLSQKYNVLKSEKNYNNEIGVPQTLFNLTEDHEIAVIEMGMNHAGEISRLSKTARPDMCVIINIDYTHVGYLGSREGIFKAKTEIFDYAAPGCTAYLNGDDDMLYSLRNSDRNIRYYGLEKYNEISAEDIKPQGFKGTDFKLTIKGTETDIHINRPGRHLIYAALAACAIGREFGLSDAQIQKGVSDFTPAGNRMEIVDTGKIVILNDVYNASPKAVKAAIDVLGYAEGRKVCILGDMGELGDYAPRMHKEVGLYAAQNGADLILCGGPLSESTAEGAKEAGAVPVWFQTRDEMIEKLDGYIKEGDTVLVKASRGMHFENVVERLKDI